MEEGRDFREGSRLKERAETRGGEELSKEAENMRRELR